MILFERNLLYLFPVTVDQILFIGIEKFRIKNFLNLTYYVTVGIRHHRVLLMRVPEYKTEDQWEVIVTQLNMK